MNADDVESEIFYALSEVEESPVEIVNKAVSQHGDPIFVLENVDNPSERFTVVILTGDKTAP